MPGSVLDALRDQFSFRTLLVGIGLLAALHVIFDASIPQLATMVGLGFVASVADAVSDAYDLRRSVERAWIGMTAVAGAAVTSAVADGSGRFPVAFLVVGVWFLLDAVQTIRHEGAIVDDEQRDGWDVYHDYVARRVHEALEERPMTRRELDEALEADEDAIDAALDRLGERDVVVRAGSEFRVAKADPDGWAGRTRYWSHRTIRRIARPLLLEFENDGGGRDPPAASGPADPGTASRGNTKGEADREQESARER